MKASDWISVNICASFVANDMRITKKEAKELQAQSGYYDELMNEVIDCLNKE